MTLSFSVCVIIKSYHWALYACVCRHLSVGCEKIVLRLPHTIFKTINVYLMFLDLFAIIIVKDINLYMK